MNSQKKSPGKRLKDALEVEKPLQVIGTINALMAMMAQRYNYRAIYLSGAGVANASYGLPDLGITTLDNVAEDARRITDVVDLPLLVDIDTGFGATAFSISRTIKTLEKVGVAGVHMEDQEAQKRCGHRPRKRIVTTEEMCNRIIAAVEAKTDKDFMVMARTDALANEGLDGAIKRIGRYIEAGADAIFPEAFTTLEEYRAVTEVFSIPILANITEFGKTPLFSVKELGSAGVSFVLYPLTAFRAMNKAAENVYITVRREGTQMTLIDKMQTRNELYELLDYYRWEGILDKLQGGDR
ncbi:MAG: methylisocitrate lyase [Candidatus Heimdallarchaeota archaeon]